MMADKLTEHTSRNVSRVLLRRCACTLKPDTSFSTWASMGVGGPAGAYDGLFPDFCLELHSADGQAWFA